MEAKKGLNNTQRKMLDEIYSEQFREKERVILAKRETGYLELRAKVLKKESSSKNVKAVLTAATKLYELVHTHSDELKQKGLDVAGVSLSKIPSLELHTGHYGGYMTHPDLVAYSDDTNRIKNELAQKKKEIRARIYGLATTYEEADAEISAVLKGINI